MSDTERMAHRPWLLFDADDTLWDNNCFFEVAISEFFELAGVPPDGVEDARERLDRIEARNILRHGYGAANFGRNLIEHLESAKGRAASPAELARIGQIVGGVRDHPVEPYAGVQETLRALAGRNRLGLATKGEISEQRAKIERSGLAGHFEHVEYFPEKDARRYRLLVKELGASPGAVWMIGNSPKSDVNPALEAGLGAVLIPNRNTWSLELQAVPQDHPRFRLVRRFRDLLDLF